jgi:N-acetylmuramoyl-L-alanine amidase
MNILPSFNILNGPTVDTSVLRVYLLNRVPRMSPRIREEIVCSYTALGSLARTGNILPFAQAVHECAGFTSKRWVESYNPAGLGATNDGAWGAVFVKPAEGITAHIAHLLVYALADGEGTYAQKLLIPFSPRLSAVESKGWRGVGKTWEDLNGRWAYPGTSYAQSICRVAREILQSSR